MYKNVMQNSGDLFIIGSPRSGTTWLQTMIGSHPHIATTVEVTLYSAYIEPLYAAWKAEKKNIDEGKWVKGMPHLFEEKEFIEILQNFIQETNKRILSKKEGAIRVLAKAPENSFFVDTIDLFSPNAKFIHIIRDGRDVVCSMRNAKKKIGFGYYEIDKCANHWKTSIVAARHASKFSDRYMEVHYEDLLDDGAKNLENIFNFIGFPLVPGKAAEMIDAFSFKNMKAERRGPDPNVKSGSKSFYKGKRGGWVEELTRDELALFYKVAGDMLVSLNYEDSANLFYPKESIAYKVFRFLKNRFVFASKTLLGVRLTSKVKNGMVQKWGKMTEKKLT